MFKLAALIFYNIRMIYEPKMKQKIKDNNKCSLCDEFLENAREFKNVDEWNERVCQPLSKW